MKRKLKKHYERWNIDFDKGAQFRQLKNRVLLAVSSLVGHYIADDDDADEEFALTLGAEPRIRESYRIEDTLGTFPSFGGTHAYKAISEAPDLEGLVTALQVLFIVLEKHGYSDETKELAEKLREIEKLGPGTGFRISIRGTSVIFSPRGAALLDEEVINQDLDWLSDYPKVLKPFEQALKTYSTDDRDNYRSLFDNLRFALEQLLRTILNNKKSFENQERQLLVWLSGRGIHQQVLNMYKQLLFGPYRIYQNDAVKHGEEYAEDEAEFMIYLTGTFMRLLLQLERKTN